MSCRITKCDSDCVAKNNNISKYVIVIKIACLSGLSVASANGVLEDRFPMFLEIGFKHQKASWSENFGLDLLHVAY